MEVHFTPDLEEKLSALAALSGRPVDALVQDAVAGMVCDLKETTSMLDGRYDDVKMGRVELIDGESFFEGLRLREEELLKTRAS